MPVDFLSEEQKSQYGRFSVEPSEDQLARYFHLDDLDMELTRRRRGNHNRLGFALQLTTVRYLGTFLANPIDVPEVVVGYLCKQLGIRNGISLEDYLVRQNTRWEHTDEIRQCYGYSDFSEQPEHWRMVRWIYLKAWFGNERPSVLFDHATARLVARKILLPGVTVLSRLVASARDRASQRVWKILSTATTPELQAKLETLLDVPDYSRQSNLDRLRKSPTRVSGPALLGGIDRLEEIRKLGANQLVFPHVPPNKVSAMARYAALASAQTVARMNQERRIASLLAFALTFEATAMDDVIDVLDMLITEIVRSAELSRKKERWRTLRDLDGAALLLRDACEVILDEKCENSEVREAVFAKIPKDELLEASLLVSALARPSDEHQRKELIERYTRVRRFLPKLLKTIKFHATPAGGAVKRALEYLESIEGERNPDMSNAPIDVAKRGWERIVVSEAGVIDRRAYTLCTLEQLQESLRRRDIYVAPSVRWGDPRAKLIESSSWATMKPKVCKSLGCHENPAEQLELLEEQLEECYRRTSENFDSNNAVEIEAVGGKESLKVSALEKLEEPESLIRLKEAVRQLLPRVELPETILEIHEHTGFLDEFTHVSEGDSRVSDLHISLSAVLLSEACNLGLEPLIRHDVPALTRRRLSWVQQNYIRADTLSAANARLVEAQSKIPLAKYWGGGEVASADGLRFVVPVRTINARPNSKYFGTERGITYYNFTSDQFTGFHGIVIPGTLRDSMFVLDGLLEQQTTLRPMELMTDTAGVSDVVFGLFWLLGYQFSPRMADIGESRFWRINPQSDYGPLNNIARNRIRTRLIADNWDDMLRIAGSLKMGKVSASELIRSLLRGKRPSTLARAVAEVGRIAKTIFQLDFIDDEAYRRRILTQLNRGESRHSIARATFHGRRGEIRHPYREGQEDQLGSLGLIVNVQVLWNTIYMQAALDQLRSNAFEIIDADVSRLSPMEHGHINYLGSYSFALDAALRNGQLRPLRNPDVSENYAP
jgi:TnpA family transposase